MAPDSKMNAYRIDKLLELNAALGMSAFAAYNKKEKMKVVVKVYTRSTAEDLDRLLKAAIRQARLFIPREGILYDVIITREIQDKERFQVNWILEQRRGNFEHFLISRDDCDPLLPPGLDAYSIGPRIYERTEAQIEIFEGTVIETNTPVVIKIYQRFKVESINDIIKEAIVQARVEHPNNTKLYDISVEKIKKTWKVALVMEKLQYDLLKLINDKSEPLEEAKFVECFRQVTAGLLYAKFRVTFTQNVAHLDLKPQNIFVGSDGNFKVGDFGGAWEKLRTSVSEQVSGTLGYLSPEMRALHLCGPSINPFTSDVYTLGLTMLHLALRNLPESEDARDIAGSVSRISYSIQVKIMLKQMLAVDESARPLLEEVHGYFQNGLTSNQLLEEERKEAKAEPTRRMMNAIAEELKKLQFEDPREEFKTYMFEGKLFFDLGEWNKAKEYLKKAQKVHRRLGGENLDSASMYNYQSMIYKVQGKLQKAEEKSIKSIQLQKGERDRNLLAEFYLNLSGIYKDQGQIQKAEKKCRKSINTLIINFGDEHSSLSICYSKLSAIYFSQDRLQEAEEMAHKSIALSIKKYGDNRGQGRYNTRDLFFDNGGMPSSECHGLKSIFQFETARGNQCDELASNHHILSEIYLSQGRLQEAEDSIHKSIEILTENYGIEDFSLSASFNHLSQIYQCQGQLQKAEEASLKSIALFKNKYEDQDQHPILAASYSNLSVIYKRQRRPREAEEICLKAIEISLNNYGNCHPSLAAMYHTLSEIYRDRGRMKEAEDAIRRSIDIYVMHYGVQLHSLAKCYRSLSSILRSQHRLEEAEEECLKSIDLSVRHYGDKHPYLAACCNDLSLIYRDQGRLQPAEEWCLKSINLATISGPSDELTLYYSNLSDIYKEKSDFIKAAAQAARISESHSSH